MVLPERDAEASELPPPRPAPGRTARRRLVADRLARVVVAAGGIGIIASICGILIFIVIEVWPLTRGAQVAWQGVTPVAGAPLVAALVDEYRTLMVGLDAAATLRVIGTDDGRVVLERPLVAAASGEPPAPEEGRAHGEPVAVTAVATGPAGRLLAAATADGRLLAVPVRWRIEHGEAGREVSADLGETLRFDLGTGERPLFPIAVALEDAGGGTAAAVAGDALVVVRREARLHLLTGEVTESFASSTQPLADEVTTLVIDQARRNLYGGTAAGALLWWQLAGEAAGAPQRVVAGSAVTALTLLIGDRSLVVGQANGSLSIWFPVRQQDGAFRLTRVRDFPPHPAPIDLLSPSRRNKGFVAHSVDGTVGLYHSTNRRTLWRGRAPAGGARELVLAPRGDAAYLTSPDGVAALAIDNPHPEATWKALFGKVWYEGYERPELVWQSTGGSDDFEPKLSLTPLLVGTLKGTLYALLLAIPLAVLAAMYTSQFLHPTYQRYVKPTVEIMAALPTVVLGFLAGLWLAPRLEQFFPALILAAFTLPGLSWLGGFAWNRLPRRVLGRVPAGTEALLLVAVLAVGLWGCVAASAAFELAVFGGSFQAWLQQTTGLTYDQRNAIVVGLAMGFAVIPIIFAISEDAFSNVPRNLVAGSLAMGATRWQTVTRVVLPTASPGIFSAIMIGFGRAVGETMIVLMATGNTPIMDWSPFNGFRTLSANIAVEIPEAPVGGTLYRTLFLAALLLFALTFVVNTVAEVVRQRLRRRYARL
ncbi:MAG TPA: ABC transporter permease subunit [Thermoanaerobaculia bacterium]|nr:ABC transporter permease subunit [Thermoanaerobaculia bacterium]